MSKKVVSKSEAAPKLQLDGKYILRLAGTLLAICGVVALLLGVVNSFTEPVIQEHKAEKTAKAMAQVLEADSYEPVECSYPGVAALHEAKSGGTLLGHVVEVKANGFGGAMSIVVGVDTEGTVTGVVVTENKETPSVGSKVVGDQKVLDRFIGMSHEGGEITVNSGNNSFDGVSGATVSSKGVAAGVNTALSAVESLKGGNN